MCKESPRKDCRGHKGFAPCIPCKVGKKGCRTGNLWALDYVKWLYNAKKLTYTDKDAFDSDRIFKESHRYGTPSEITKRFEATHDGAEGKRMFKLKIKGLILCFRRYAGGPRHYRDFGGHKRLSA
jgi:hypothetical protein